MSEQRLSELGEPLPQMVGRAQELDRLERYLHARGDRNVVYYWARGGLGKTRLLQELCRLVDEAGLGYYSTGIIDLYHTDTHSTSDVDRTIVEGLDPEKKRFYHYRHARQEYELLRERGTDRTILEQRRKALNGLFVQECREMALDARKLVICFDTVELLQHESSVVEEMAGRETTDTRLKPWLLGNLAQLANVLIVFAGRPMGARSDESLNLQARFVADLEQAFDQDLTIVELQPFTLQETQAFIKALTDHQEILSEQYLPVVHRLTAGRPIFLHLIVDLVQVLALDLQRILAMFDQYAHLVDAPADDEELQEARDKVETHILNSIFNQGALGEYLRYVALLPKGIDREILHQVLGLPRQDAEKLLKDLIPLSFVKQFTPLPGAERLHGERIFLHDEMYRLLTRRDVMPNMHINERHVAQSVIKNYYDPQISQFLDHLQTLEPEQRVSLRERMQKLQVERLYYLLVRDPAQGYEAYKRLTDLANRRRWVGFGMRLLDEFLRFYNVPERRRMFEAVGINQEQVIRESTRMWVERFHWWGQYDREIRFTDTVLDRLEDCFIDREQNAATLGIIYALRTLALAVLEGHNRQAIEEARAALDRLPPVAQNTQDELLARARLCTAIGYQLRLGGQLAPAAEMYVQAKTAFLKMGGERTGYQDEYAMLLNNLSFVYARQGQMVLARPLGHEALQINERIGNEYSTGLTLSTLSQIALMRENYAQALTYAEEALALFRDLQDPHGMALAYQGVARARRRMARHEIEKGRGLEEPQQQLEATIEDLDRALQIAQEAKLSSDIHELRAERGRVSRDLGHTVRQREGLEKALVHYRQSERDLRQALENKETNALTQADMLQDLAETLVYSKDEAGARQCLAQVEELVGLEQHDEKDEQIALDDLSPEAYSVLRKVEMLRGHMAFSQEALAEGLRHYVLAYAYLARFSPDAPEKNAMVEYLYNYVREAPVEQQQHALAQTQDWIEDERLGAEVGSLIEIVENLLGI